MYSISEDFKSAMQAPIKELQGFINTDEHTITSENDLIEFKITVDSDLTATAMRKLEFKSYGEYNLLNQWVEVGFGVKLNDNSFEYLTYGDFLITEQTYIKDEDTSTYIGYDKMITTMQSYNTLNIEYPITLYDYTVELCNEVGVELFNDNFLVHNNWIIDGELWENINDITYRDIITQIAQVTCTTAIIHDNKLYFKPLTATNESLTYDNMMNLKLENLFGEINSIVLSRSPQEDNIYMKNDESIDANGLTEWRIENNEIIDKNRESAISDIYDAMYGISYYPFESKTEGLGYFEIADNIDIVNNEGDLFNTSIFNITITFDGGINEVLKTIAPTLTQTQYKYASTISKRLKNTEITVNKQEQYINQLVSDMYDENGIIHENFTEIHQDITNIINSVQTSGGANLIKNSVMFAYDTQNNPTDWDVTGNGTLDITPSAESINYGCISGHVFILNDKTVKQRVNVSVSTDNTRQVVYSFSTKVKKSLAGTAYVKIYNDVEEYTINIEYDSNELYKEYSLQGLLPQNNYYDVEFYGSADSNSTFTDNILSVGEYKQEWQQADGELMNTQVNINKDGVLVKSSIYAGDYTVMSPLEFAGYSKINGVVTKIFSLNKDTTISKKLTCEDEITMNPIKIVPVTTGNLIGWAFVPTINEEVE